MALSAPRRFAITGAPGAGKTTLIDALTTRGWITVSESARTILRRDGGMEMRERDPSGFALAMLASDLSVFDNAHSGQTLIFDRGFADIAGFLEVEGLPPLPEVENACRLKRFETPVFRAPPWKEIYVQDEQRTQTWEEAVESDRLILNAWRKHGYDPIDLPFLDVAERVAFLESHLGPTAWRN